MGTWGFWERLGCSSLWIGAILLALETGLSQAPSVRDKLPAFVGSRRWGFAPIVLIAISAVAFAVGWGLLAGPTIDVEAKPQLPWLQTPKERPTYKNWAIRPSLRPSIPISNVRLTLLEIYKFKIGAWSSPLNSEVKTDVAWFSEQPFGPQYIAAHTQMFMAPLVINMSGSKLQYQLNTGRENVPEILEWAAQPLTLGRYKLSIEIDCDQNVCPMIFNLIVDWFGSPDTLDISIQ